MAGHRPGSSQEPEQPNRRRLLRGDRSDAADPSRSAAPPPRDRDHDAGADDDRDIRWRPSRPGAGEDTSRPLLPLADRDDPPLRTGGTDGSAFDEDPFDPAAWSEDADPITPPPVDDWQEPTLTPAAPPRPAPGRRRARNAVGRVPTNGPGTRGSEAPRRSRGAGVNALLGRFRLFEDRVVLGLLGAGLLSLAAMVVLVAVRYGDASAPLAVRLNAAGIPDRWGTPRLLWRLPVMAGMLLAMNLVAAWAISSTDRFAARFIAAATVAVHLVVWVALVKLL